MIRVGRRVYSGSKYIDPSYPEFTPILCLTVSSPYGALGPYVLRNEKGVIIENLWQFSKIYREVPASTQKYSRYDSTIIWNHPAEVHIEKDIPTQAYWQWREKGFACQYPIRYPVGFNHRHKCEYSLMSIGEIAGRPAYVELDYIEARKSIYLPAYVQAVQRVTYKKSNNQKKLSNTTLQYINLIQRHAQGENLLIIEVDGPHQESLEYYQKKYRVPGNWIENNTILCNKENLNIMLNDPKHPFGHGYCLAWALLENVS